MTREEAICREATMKIEGGRMSEKKYPTRMHEVLGVETGERFEIPNYVGEVYVDNYGYLFSVSENDFVCGARVCEAINHPERLTRRPRLTEEQVARLKALVALEATYLAKNKDASVGAFINKPTKNALYWNTNDSYVFYLSIVGTCLSDLVSWSDPAPLDIVQVLRQNGVEVEG